MESDLGWLLTLSYKSAVCNIQEVKGEMRQLDASEERNWVVNGSGKCVASLKSIWSPWLDTVGYRAAVLKVGFVCYWTYTTTISEAWEHPQSLWKSISNLQFPYLINTNVDQSENSPHQYVPFSCLLFSNSPFLFYQKEKESIVLNHLYPYHDALPQSEKTSRRKWTELQLVVGKGMTNYYGQTL